MDEPPFDPGDIQVIMAAPMGVSATLEELRDLLQEDDGEEEEEEPEP